MIHFRLACANDHEFEGWFQDGASFERQIEKKQIECPVCQHRKIRKAPMAPAVARSGSAPEAAAGDTAEAAKMHRALTQLREGIEKTHENVGDRFAEEARRIHYGETARRGIYGRSTDEEAGELADEGVPFARIPWPRRSDS